jgi:hypothetical protein
MVTELESICHDHMILYQFIHKITEQRIIFMDSVRKMNQSGCPTIWLTVDEWNARLR